MVLRQYLGLAGILLALAGVALESHPLVWGAIGVRGLSLALKFVQSVRRRRAEAGMETPGDDAGGP
jgi:hypothetical protein